MPAAVTAWGRRTADHEKGVVLVYCICGSCTIPSPAIIFSPVVRVCLQSSLLLDDFDRRSFGILYLRLVHDSEPRN